MGMLGWVLMGLALWHFTIWLPDHFWGGLVGAFVAALAGSILCGLLIYGIKVSAVAIPGKEATDLVVVLYSIPGALIGMGIAYVVGLRAERELAMREAAPQRRR